MIHVVIGSRAESFSTMYRVASPRTALRRKEWLLLRRDPWLASQTLMQILYLLPPAILLWRTFEAGGGALNLLVPVLVMAAGQLAAASPGSASRARMRPTSSPPRRFRDVMFCAPRSRP